MSFKRDLVLTRDDFLAHHWKRYPPLETPAIDCREALSAVGRVKVGGRLSKDQTRRGWALTSAGAQLALDLTRAQWSTLSSLGDPPVFDDAHLSHGDLLALSGEVRDGFLRVTDVVLLFAVSDRSWQRRPEGPPPQLNWSIDSAERWATFVLAVRSFFGMRDFIEARTPTLVPSPGTEPFLDPFRTSVVFGAREMEMFLPTSPEFHLKKLLIGGFTKLFELKDCFRNNERGSHHQPEFLMLEWYRAYSDLSAIAADVDDLFLEAAVALGLDQPPRLIQTSMRDLFDLHLNFSLKPTTSKVELLELAARSEIDALASDSWNDIFFRIFLARVEPELARGGPWLVRDYPPSQAALARINADGWADRFEIYWRGLEIANAFHELNDPEANLQRFLKDAEEKRANGKLAVPHDEELVHAFYVGMPPSGGIALGMDRLFMALIKEDRIEKTRAFPHRE